MLYGLRGDLVQLNDSPIRSGGPDSVRVAQEPVSTGWYGLYNGNVSVVYSPTEHMSAYLTYNKAQYVAADANDGAIAAWGVDAEPRSCGRTPVWKKRA